LGLVKKTKNPPQKNQLSFAVTGEAYNIGKPDKGGSTSSLMAKKKE